VNCSLLLGVRDVSQHITGRSCVCGPAACCIKETERAAETAGECNGCQRTALAVLAAAASTAAAGQKVTV